MTFAHILAQQATATLSSFEIQYIANEVREYPTNQVFFKNTQLSHEVYRMQNNAVVAIGQQIGSGSWGNVHIAMKYDLNAPQGDGTACVIKIPKKKNRLGRLLDYLTHLNKRMDKECALVQAVHGAGEALHVKINDKNKTIIVLPFLGETTLASVLKRENLLATIEISEWLKLFLTLCEKLNEFHIKTNSIHNDIKPENIGVTLRESVTGYLFHEINFFDFGNAHRKYGAGLCGDPHYQPIESSIGLFIPRVKNEKVDIYSLGKTLLHITNILLDYAGSETERAIYYRCMKLFKQMTSFYLYHRPDLMQCIDELRWLVCSVCPNENSPPTLRM